jgi:hypothetical protein
LLRDYNALSRSAEDSLGRWLVSGGGNTFNSDELKTDALQAILFMPPGRALVKPQVRAFSIQGLSF